MDTIKQNIDIIEISREESVNIQTYEDWWRAENYLKKIKYQVSTLSYRY